MDVKDDANCHECSAHHSFVVVMIRVCMAVQWVIHCFIWRRAQLVDACLVVVQLHNQLTLVEMISD